MANNLCIFAKYRWWVGYKQYPPTSYADSYSELFAKASKRQNQIIVCVKDNKIHYAYLYRMWNGVVWLCFQHKKICVDFERLFSFLNSSLNDMGREEIIVKKSKGGLKVNDINLSNPKLRGKLKDYLKNLEKDLDNLISAKSDYLSNDKGGDITDEVIEYELSNKGSAYFAEKINERYTVIILQSNNEEDRKKQSQAIPPQKNVNNTSDTGMDATSWITLGVMVAIILLNLIVPWFVSTMPIWLKFALIAATGFGMYAVVYALEDNHKGSYVAALGWSGAIAISLSTIITIYGLCGGFGPDTVDEVGNVQTVTDSKNVPESEQGNITSIPTPVAPIPNNFVRVSSGASDFYIDKYEVTQRDYERIMGCNPSKFKGDSIPVHNISIFDAVLYCNRKSEAEGYDGFYEIDSNSNVKLKYNGNGYRLPTDYEWTLAAQSVKNKNIKNTDGNKLEEIAWYRENSGNKPQIIGKSVPNDRKIYDMNGNVLELCLYDNGNLWGKGGGYNLNISFDEKTGMGYGGTLSSRKSQGDNMGMRLVFIPKRKI